jgi:hypothetical protein
MEIRYEATAYRQAKNKDAPWIISFVASAEELLKWVGIPRRSEKGLIGFQRLETPERVERAKEFFNEPFNQSPTAIILGIHKAHPGLKPQVHLEFLKNDGEILPCRLTINLENFFDDREKLKNHIKEQINYRLSQDMEIGDDDLKEDEVVQDYEYSVGDADGDSDEEEDSTPETHGGDIELGRSLLKDLRSKLDDDDWFSSNYDALVDYAKPATLIDGQHRIKGAELNERNIPFTVCALFDCSWSEQVFQFTIVNYTQSGIPDQFITANAALSLTKNELNGLNSRLSQANVKVIEYELMKVVNFDEASPFFQLVDLSSKKSTDKIGYKTMVKVAKQWWQGRHSGVLPIIENLYPELQGKKSNVRQERLRRWQTEDWGEFFIVFWKEVQKAYQDSPSYISGSRLWEVGKSNLMIAVVLLQLQEAFLENIGDQDEDFFRDKTKSELLKKIQERSAKFVTWYPADFFGREWKTKSLNTGAGKLVLIDCFNELKKKKGQFGYANSSLVTGKTSN